ncbi:MAG: hypothetical protein WCP63_08370, partial [Cyanobium sp. ELA712]
MHPASYFEAAAGFPPLPFQQAWMEQGEESAPIRTLAEQIAVECRAVMARLGVAIPVHVLRGGQIENDYADALAAEAVIVGTLDQVVSRQPMRGYCCSRWSWPRHFAALNTDVRVVVDETQLQGEPRRAPPSACRSCTRSWVARRRGSWCSAPPPSMLRSSAGRHPPSWAERCRLRPSRGAEEGGPHQAAHHRDRWEQLLLAGRTEEAMEVVLGGEGGWPTLKPELFAAMDGVGCQIGSSGSPAGLSVRPAAPARRWGRGAR